MHHTIAQYAQALVNAVGGASSRDIKTIARNTVRLLRAKKHLSKLPAILRETRRRYFYKKNITTIDIISVVPLSPAIRNEIRRMAGASAHINEIVRPEVMAGIKIIVNDTYRIDATVKGIIRNLFAKYEKHS